MIIFLPQLCLHSFKAMSKKNAKRLQEEAHPQPRRGSYCKALCCSTCRLSVSSSTEESADNSNRYASISSLAHAMIQERLDQMIRERQEETRREEEIMRRSKAPRRRTLSEGMTTTNTKFIVMVAMEKSSYDPREDFRESMVEMIMANRIEETRDLRRLLNYYVTMNSEEYRSVILEVFHEVCTYLFLFRKWRY